MNDPQKETGATPAAEATSPPNADAAKPDAPITEKTLEAQLADAKAEAAKNLDGWQRASAEFINYRKRVDKERTDTYSNAAVDTYTRMLPIIDDLDRAIAFVPADRKDDKAIDGFRQIHRKFLNMLEAAGVKQINPVDQPFDPAFHEAIGQDEGTGKESGTVTVVLQKGFLYGDKVLRAAMVRVAS